MPSQGQPTAAAPTVSAVDLGALPHKPSRILTGWLAARQQQRTAERAEQEAQRAIAMVRRFGAPRSRKTGAPEAAGQAGLPAVGAHHGRAFSGAAADRLTSGWAPVNTGINADLEAGLARLVARSRDWCTNTDQGARYLQLVADNVVGHSVPRLQVRATLADGRTQDDVANGAIERAWHTWCDRHADVSGRLTMAEMCRAVVCAAARDGEYLVKRLRNASLPMGYAQQLLDVDRIDTGTNLAPQRQGDTAIRLGVELDALGRVVALWVFQRHPGDGGGGALTNTSQRMLAPEFFHGFVAHRPEQVRGYPWPAAVLKRAHTLDVYEGYALQAAKHGAAKMGFYTVDKEAVDQVLTFETMRDATGELAQDVEGGMLEALPPGVSFQSFDPTYPAEAFAEFVQEHKRGIASGLGVAHHNLTGNMTGVNYSSARIAELAERRHWRALQHWFIRGYLMPTFGDWLAMALQTGSIRLPSGAALPPDRFDKFLDAASFQPPGWAWVDPEKDLRAAALAMSYDLRSLRQLADEQGVDVDDTLQDKSALLARYAQLGLPVPAWLNGAGGISVTPTPASAGGPASNSAGTGATAQEPA